MLLSSLVGKTAIVTGGGTGGLLHERIDKSTCYIYVLMHQFFK